MRENGKTDWEKRKTQVFIIDLTTHRRKDSQLLRHCNTSPFRCYNTPQDFSLAKEAGSKIYLPRVGQTSLHGIRILWHFRLSPGPSGAVGEDRTRCCSIRSPAVCLWPRAALTLTQFQEKLTLSGFLSSNLHSQIEGLPTIKMIKSACVPEREKETLIWTEWFNPTW